MPAGRDASAARPLTCRPARWPVRASPPGCVAHQEAGGDTLRLHRAEAAEAAERRRSRSPLVIPSRASGDRLPPPGRRLGRETPASRHEARPGQEPRPRSRGSERSSCSAASVPVTASRPRTRDAAPSPSSWLSPTRTPDRGPFHPAGGGRGSDRRGSPGRSGPRGRARSRARPGWRAGRRWRSGPGPTGAGLPSRSPSRRPPSPARPSVSRRPRSGCPRSRRCPRPWRGVLPCPPRSRSGRRRPGTRRRPRVRAGAGPTGPGSPGTPRQVKAAERSSPAVGRGQFATRLRPVTVSRWPVRDRVRRASRRRGRGGAGAGPVRRRPARRAGRRFGPSPGPPPPEGDPGPLEDEAGDLGPSGEEPGEAELHLQALARDEVVAAAAQPYPGEGQARGRQQRQGGGSGDREAEAVAPRQVPLREGGRPRRRDRPGQGGARKPRAPRPAAPLRARVVRRDIALRLPAWTRTRAPPRAAAPAGRLGPAAAYAFPASPYNPSRTACLPGRIFRRQGWRPRMRASPPGTLSPGHFPAAARWCGAQRC